MAIRKILADLAVRDEGLLGEHPAWDDANGGLVWVDVAGHRVVFASPDGPRSEWSIGRPVTAVFPLADPHRYLLVTESGIEALDRTTGEITTVLRLPAGEGRRNNDACLTPDGDLLVGTIAADFRSPVADLSLVSRRDLSVTPLLEGIVLSNGVAFSARGDELFHVDSYDRVIRAYRWTTPFEPDGEIVGGPFDSDDRGFVPGGDLAATDVPALPDGIAVDRENTIWVALFAEGRVLGLTPRVGVHTQISVPTRYVTSCAPGHTPGTLYITTARHRLSAQELAREPDAGSVFVADVGAGAVRVPAPEGWTTY